jgi:thiosulfate reductase/polysulfide reductase chain A
MKAFADLPPGVGYYIPDEYRYSMCGTCDSNCGVIFHMKEGIIREIQGNPADELGGQGNICVKGQSAMRNIYDPDLLKVPMIRTNPLKGVDEDPGWAATDWDTAFTMIGDKMQDAIDTEGIKSIVVMARPKEEDMHFVRAIGTPNQVCHVDTCYINHEGAWKAVLGTSRSRTMETEKSTYLLCFGYDMPGKSKMAQLRCFLEAKANGAKVVVFDPRLSITANMADEWVPIKPGTDLAVALAMIHVIINEGLYNTSYVAANCYGLAELTTHVNDGGYTPEWAESISGIPAADIERIAREFAGSAHPIIPNYKRCAGGPVYANSHGLSQSQMILNALVGAIEREGGHYFTRGTSTPPGLSGYTYPPRDGTIRVDGQHMFPVINSMFASGVKSKGNMSHLADGLKRARTGAAFPDAEPSYPVKVILAHKYNTHTIPNKDTFIDEICHPDADIFMAVVDSIPNDLCWFADVILPEPWWAEGKGYGTTSQHCLWQRLYLKDGIGAQFSRKGGGSIYNGILAALGKPEFVVDWGGLKNTRMATFATTHGLGSSADDLKDWLKANEGIWQDKVYPIIPKSLTTLKTPSGKIELCSQYLAGKGHEACPTWHEKLAVPGADNEFYLVTHHNPYHRMYKNCNDPLIMDLQPESLIHMHPDAAALFGVVTGDYVRVKNPVIDKELVIKVKVTKGIRPDTVMTEHGYGSISKNQSVACGKGVCDGDLLPARELADSLTRYNWNPSMASCILDTIVEIVGKE